MNTIDVRNRIYPKTSTDGYKIIGPPTCWIDKKPPINCELFINFQPEDMIEALFMYLCSRFGIVFQIRLKFDKVRLQNQGIGYLRYTIHLDALAALEMINRHFLPSGNRIKVSEILRSRCLIMSPVPKDLPNDIVNRTFGEIFPQMESLIFDETLGCVYVNFENYVIAAQVKEMVIRENIKLWNENLIVTWSKIEYKKALMSKKIFIVRGVRNERIRDKLKGQIKSLTYQKDDIELDYTGNQVTVTCKKPSDASFLHRSLQNSISEQGFSIQWAMNSPKCWTLEDVSDYCAELRMICIANAWQIPIILFGKYFPKNHIQYGSVLLTDKMGYSVSFLMEVETNKLTDIQATICEVVVRVVHKIGGLPQESKVYKVTCSQAFEVCSVISLLPKYKATDNLIADWTSIHEMVLTLQQLFMFSDEQILYEYKLSFLGTTLGLNRRQVLPNCASVYPKYRNKPPLPHNLNDTEIVLVLKNNLSSAQLFKMNSGLEPNENAIPLRALQTWEPDLHVINYVVSRMTSYYHPSQRINVAPVWIPGNTYGCSTKNLIM